MKEKYRLLEAADLFFREEQFENTPMKPHHFINEYLSNHLIVDRTVRAGHFVLKSALHEEPKPMEAIVTKELLEEYRKEYIFEKRYDGFAEFLSLKLFGRRK